MRSETHNILLFLVGIAAAGCTLVGYRMEIKPTNEKVLLPTYAYQDEHGSWTIQVNGWVFRPYVSGSADASHVKNFLEKHAIPNPIEDKEKKNLHVRVHEFLIKNISGDYAQSGLGKLGPSDPDGHLDYPLHVEHKNNIDEWLQFELDTRGDNSCPHDGSVHFTPREGLSVISDIDDTIKVSEVWNKEPLLANTFLHDFKAVNEMARYYQLWKHNGASFHYVSASPWPLYQPLEDFMCSSKFPPGTIHLKPFDWESPKELYELFKKDIQLDYKKKTIEPILRNFPNRKFALFGDSTEWDPEAYGDLAREHPGQIIAICIRAVNYDTREGKQMTEERHAKAFHDIPDKKRIVFTEPRELEGTPCLP